MSIDDIIRHIDEDCMHSYRDEADYAWVELQYIPKIVALLKAGQAMQRDIRKHNRFAHFDNMVSEIGSKAWDVATGGEG